MNEWSWPAVAWLKVFLKRVAWILVFVYEFEWMKRNEWMSEWMNEWMNDRMNEWMNEWSNEWMNLLKIYLVDVHCKNPEKSLLVSISVSITVLAKIILGLESYSVIN